MIGASNSPEAKARFRAQFPEDGGTLAQRYGWAGSGAGKLVIPFVYVLEAYPGCLPGRQGQGRGDCVSWSTKNAALLTMVGDVVGGLNDETTGKPEECPEVPAAGVADGVLSTEAFYWHRGYDGDGWMCADAAQVACKKSGVVLRQSYPELGLNLTSYSASTAGKWGRRSPPANVVDAFDDHLIHRAVELTTWEDIRDALANLHGVSTCGGEGLADRRDENGVTRVKGSWSHAMAYIGADDRDWARQKYGCGLVLDLNSWGADWISGPRDIFDSAQFVPPEKREKWVSLGVVNASTGNIMIPEGSGWVPYDQMRRRDCYAFAGAKGWEKKYIPPDFRPW